MASTHKFSWVAFMVSLYMNFSFKNVVKAAPESALVKHVPGFNGTFPSKHYAGYIDINKKHLYYYFVQSERDPLNDPLVLWLNGGPGCSSTGGFVHEHGPFNFLEGKNIPTLHINQYSWSKVSNIIYLDSPAGVGLSYVDNSTDHITSDFQTASDTCTFLIKWLQDYPEYQRNSFYVASESYGGVFAPTLVSAIVAANEAGQTPKIKIEGYLIGNGIFDHNEYNNGLVPFARGMALISEDLYMATEAACDGNYRDNKTEACSRLLDKINHVLEGLNSYNILLDPSAYSDQLAEMWLNNENVRRAIHAKPASVSGEWAMCTYLNYTYNAGNMIPYHKNLTAKGYRALIYSGDHDMVVPYTGSEAWTRSIGYKIVDEWRSWKVDDYVAGFTQGYDKNLTFLTIKGAGHMVPYDKPKEALSFYSRWLKGQPI